MWVTNVWVNDIPNWGRVLLLIPTLLSFAPQLERLLSRRNSRGISLDYALFNLICTTEQFTLGFFFVVNNIDGYDFFVQTPVDTGDWLNLLQLALVWLLWLVLFVLCCYYAPEEQRTQRDTVIRKFAAFCMISIVPLLVDAFTHDAGSSVTNSRRWFGAIFHGVHSMLINPAVTILTIYALFPQAREIYAHPRDTALSVGGLAVQVIVFELLAGLWLGRLKFPYEEVDGISMGLLKSWYQLVGFVVLDNALFAAVQGMLFYIATRAMANRPTSPTPPSHMDENTPLLHSGGGRKRAIYAEKGE